MKFLIGAIVVVGLTIGSNATGGGKKYGKDLTVKEKTALS